VLVIFSNLDSSNAPSIVLNSLIKNFSKDINLKFYKINLGKNEIETIKDYYKYYNNSKIVDKEKKNIKNNEIQSIEVVEKYLVENKFDVILGWSNPYMASTIAIALGQKYNIPVVLRLGDFYISTKSENKLNEFINAKCLIVPNEILCKKVIEFYGKQYEYKIKVIPQHYENYELLNDNINNNNYINFLHTGNMYQERKIDKFIEIIGNLDDNIKNKIRLEFIGCHDKLKDDIDICNKNKFIADFSKCYQFENWYFEKSIPYYDLRKFVKSSDILLHIEYISENNHFLSFKMIDYLSYNKPIITISQKNSPNYYLAKECGFAFGNIEDKEQLIEIFIDIINNPNKYIPNNNKLKYNISNIVKKWENELFLYSKPNYETIKLFTDNSYDEKKINIWIEKLHMNSYYKTNKFNRLKKYKKLYTIWVMTTQFSELLLYTIQNLNYLGYNYKIIINDNEVNALNFMKNNTKSKYWFRCDDDFILMEKSIEYMIDVKENIKEPVCIFRLYDLNYGYFSHYTKIKTYARYGIKIHETNICKKINYDNTKNSDIFYKELYKYGGYLNYKDWLNNGIIVGYHQLFNSNFDIFVLYFKMACKFKIYEQDLEILWNYFIKICDTRIKLIGLLNFINNKYLIIKNNFIINDFFEYNKFFLILNKNNYLINNANWLEDTKEINILEIYNNISYKDIIKISGFLYGLENDYIYETKYINNYFNDFKKINLINEKIDYLIIINDINKIDNFFLSEYHNLKFEKKNIKVYSFIPLITLCDKIDIYDLINFENLIKLNEFIKSNNINVINLATNILQNNIDK